MTTKHLADGSDLFLVGLVNPSTGQPAGTSPATAFYSSTLPSTAPVVVAMAGAPLPATLTISGAAGVTRKIELSTDGGSANGWFTPTYDASTTNMINVSVSSSVTHARFTGGAGDAASVR